MKQQETTAVRTIWKRTPSSEWVCEEDTLIREESFRLFYEGKLITEGPISPEYLDEWGRGHLVSEGFCSLQTPLRIWREQNDLFAAKIASPEEPAKEPSSQKIPCWSITEKTLFEGIQKVQEAPRYCKTGAAHVATLFSKSGELLVLREDMGRYNAADKVLGWGIARGVDFAETFFLFSGRMPRGVVRKIAQVGIPLAGSVSAPTWNGAALAEEHHITLIGFLRPPRMNLYVKGKISLEGVLLP
jgi:FdhD protein